MKIEFVNHASVIFSHGKIRLMTDAWISGLAFNNSWSLLSESKFQFKDFEQITHLWFSHEHPDHFNMTVLKQISPDTRKNITVLFQDTRDHRVINKCKELGFKTVELKRNKFYELDVDFKILCEPVPYYDSWLYLVIDGKKILNLNDCVINTIPLVEKIYSITGKIDVLLTQFGYASGIGNENDEDLRIESAKEELYKMKLQIDKLQPKYTIPFASFVRFCHPFNQYMNKNNNSISLVNDYLKKETKTIPVIMYPSETWDCETPFYSNAINEYHSDMAKPLKLFDKKFHYSFEQLDSLAEKYIDRLKEKNNWFLVKLLHKKGYFGRTVIYLTDLQRPVSFDITVGLEQSSSELPMEWDIPKYQSWTPDIVTDSDSLAFVFLQDYGLDTLHVNGRYRRAKDYKNFFRQFYLGILNNNGYSVTDLILNYVVKRIKEYV